MPKTVRRYYWIALAVLLALSAYPLVMGAKIVALQLIRGGIRPSDYARYVIPYTAVSVAVLVSTALYPVLSKLKKFTVPVATVLALGLFTGIEMFIEGIVRSAVLIQLFSCVYTPTALSAFDGVYDDSYKIHYFLVSFTLISLLIGVFYGYGKMLSEANRSKKVPLGMQLAVTILLLGFCIFANFTGFFREKTDFLPPLSAFLTGFYFVVLGTAAGIYAGSWLIGRRSPLSVWLPSAVALLVCSVMYYGEYSMFEGMLYRFGVGWFFEGLPGIVLAPADLLVVAVSGAAAAGAMALARRFLRKQAAAVSAV